MPTILRFRQRTFVFTTLLLPSLATAGVPDKPRQNQESESPFSGAEDTPRTPQPPWGLLNFFVSADDACRSHGIKRIKITLPEKQATPWQAGFTADNPILYETDDPHVLEAMGVFLTRPLRLATPRDVHGGRGDGSSSSVGTILVVTNTEEFTIGVSRVGFVLSDDTADLPTTFYSWGLAHFLDELCSKRAQTHIPPKVLIELTGEARIERDRKALETMKQRDRERK